MIEFRPAENPLRATAGDNDPAAGPFLGIDTGLQCTGYAILSDDNHSRGLWLHEAGVIRLKAGTTIEKRLVELEAALQEVIAQHCPAVLACEELYAHYAHPRTAILMGHARGVVLLAAARARMRVLSISATRIKKTLTGNGHAGKQQMQKAIALTLGLARPPEPNDVADAIAVALAGIQIGRAAGRRKNGRRA